MYGLSYFEKFAVAHGLKYVSDVKPDNIEQFKLDLRDENYEPRTINMHLLVIGMMFRWATDQGYCGQNPMRRVPRLHVPKKPPRYFSLSEIAKIRAVATGDIADAFDILVETGLRSGEFQHLEWTDLDFVNGVVYVRSKQNWSTKTGQSRAVPMTSRVREILVRRMKQSKPGEPLVFTSNEGKSLRWLWHRMVTLYAKAGIGDATVHTCRHTYASHLLQRQGLSLYEVSKLFGHADIKTTQIYAHLEQRLLTERVHSFSYEIAKPVIHESAKADCTAIRPGGNAGGCWVWWRCN